MVLVPEYRTCTLSMALAVVVVPEASNCPLSHVFPLWDNYIVCLTTYS